MKLNKNKRLKAMGFLGGVLSPFNSNITTAEESEDIFKCNFPDKSSIFKLFDKYIKSDLASSPLGCFLTIAVLEKYLLNADESFEDALHELVFGDILEDPHHFMKLLLEYAIEISINQKIDDNKKVIYNYKVNEML
ncbi:hypothetical protein JBO49_05715 [Serratia fonticola]|uniref:hypothetical protein n=1 Tax=Serratia fonticola TaxID=47917 RepID=UPI00192C8133|nr:hypothetical protein [Serratia fonticola]MBL5860112.1 hypothetical protein [Serratia fonticola]